ncbi:MAG: response regulator [Bacteroidota bacterium]
MTILVADDMLFNRIFISNIIETLGHTSILKNNGQEVIDYLETNTADAIILDIEMPVMNGLETATHIKQVLKLKTPIAAISSHNSDEYDTKMKNAGFDYILAKPVNITNVCDFLIKKVEPIASTPESK